MQQKNISNFQLLVQNKQSIIYNKEKLHSIAVTFLKDTEFGPILFLHKFSNHRSIDLSTTATP